MQFAIERPPYSSALIKYTKSTAWFIPLMRDHPSYVTTTVW